MDITDYIPNIFGAAAPTSYEGLQTMGLISPQQVAQQQKTANIQGLLGAGLALAQGMSRTGPRRSAAENILGALAGGFGAAGGAYQQGIQNVVQQQQLQSAALQQQQNINRLKSIELAKQKYPDIAQLADIDQGKFAEEVALRERIKGISGTQAGAGQEQTVEGLRAIADQYYAAGPNFKALGDSYTKKADLLQASKLANLTGNETPDQLFALSRTAAANGNKELADKLQLLAEQKQLQPPQATVAQPTAAQPVPEQQAQMPSALGVTAKGETFNGVPNYAAGERYVDETMHQTALEQQRTLPPTVIQASGKLGQLQSSINTIDAELARVSAPDFPLTEQNTKYQSNLRARREILVKDLDRYSVMEYDFTDLKSLPNKYQGEVKQLEKQAQGGTLDLTGLNSRIEKIYTRLQEDEKGRSLTGNAAIFAQMKFGVADRAQLTGPQLAEVLRFENAPTADQLAQLERESIKTRVEFGITPSVPVGRESMISAPTQKADQQPTVQQTITTTIPRQVAVTTTRPAITTQQVTTEPKVAQPRGTGGYSAVIANKQVNFDSLNKDALINKPESILPIKQRQKLELEKPGTQSLASYSLRGIVDSRNSAKELLSNEKYLDALSSRGAKFLSGDIAGFQIDQETAAANALLNNLLTRSFVTELQDMRRASPTGAGVGSVTEKEGDALSKIRAAIQLGLPKNELIRQLQQYVNVSERAMVDIPREYAKTYTYQGEFKDILESNVVPSAKDSGKNPVQQELDRRKGRNP